jgi:hypothetical protein
MGVRYARQEEVTVITNPVYLRIRAALCDESTVGDLDEYAAHIARTVLAAQARARRGAA